MNEEYRRKLLSAEDAAELIQSGQTVHLAGGALTPLAFGNALANLAGRRQGVRLLTYLPLAPMKVFSAPGAEETFELRAAFYNGILRGPDRAGWCSFVPNHLRNIARDWDWSEPEVDWMVVTVSPMDKHGYFTLAASAIMEWERMLRAKKLIVEVASHAPRVFGDTHIHLSQVDAIVESDRYPCELPRETPGPEDELLGGHVAELVEDGSTIQLGFGGTIDALARRLRDKRDLGIHTESFSDCAMELMQCGAVNNRCKSLHPRVSVTSFTMGSKALYDFVDDNPAILHKSLSYTNALEVLAQNRKMVSINATLQIDLSGQCASEGVGTLQISGSGGQVDTGVGAQMAGGKSIITLKSTRLLRDPETGEERLTSQILPVLPAGSTVTYTRSNTQYVVTEYGAVCLRGLSLRDRARSLISIAHPQFRDWLEEEYGRLWRARL